MKSNNIYEIKTKEKGYLKFNIRRKFKIGETTFLQCRPIDNCLSCDNKKIYYITDKGLSVCFSSFSDIYWLSIIHTKSWYKVMPVLMAPKNQQKIFKSLDNFFRNCPFCWDINQDDLLSINRSEDGGEKMKDLFQEFREAIGAKFN